MDDETNRAVVSAGSSASGRSVPGKKQKRSGGGRFERGHVPHNRRALPHVESLEDVVKQVLSEPRKVLQNGKEVEMCLAERAIRLEVDKAVGGDTRAIARIVKLLIKHPKLSRSYKATYQIFLNGIAAKL